MNALQLAQRIEADYGVLVSRDKDGKPIVSVGAPSDIKSAPGITISRLNAYCEYNGGIRDCFEIYISSITDNVDSYLLTQQGFNILDRYNQRAAVAEGVTKQAVLSSLAVEPIARKVTEIKAAPKPIEA